MMLQAWAKVEFDLFVFRGHTALLCAPQGVEVVHFTPAAHAQWGLGLRALKLSQPNPPGPRSRFPFLDELGEGCLQRGVGAVVDRAVYSILQT